MGGILDVIKFGSSLNSCSCYKIDRRCCSVEGRTEWMILLRPTSSEYCVPPVLANSKGWNHIDRLVCNDSPVPHLDFRRDIRYTCILLLSYKIWKATKPLPTDLEKSIIRKWIGTGL